MSVPLTLLVLLYLAGFSFVGGIVIGEAMSMTNPPYIRMGSTAVLWPLLVCNYAVWKITDVNVAARVLKAVGE
jgi:hypothetical protein